MRRGRSWGYRGGGEVCEGVDGSKAFSSEKEISRALTSSSQVFIFFQILTVEPRSNYQYPHTPTYNKYIMHNSVLPPVLPATQQQRQQLIAKLKQEMVRICPDDARAAPEALEKKAILSERVRLIGSCQEYSEVRLGSLEKIFTHYSTHLFRSGQKYDFDQIGYLNQHLIIERFFAFINDFKLNQITFNGQPTQLADRNDIILIFKKSSSNARNLDFPEFIACLERLFVFFFNQNQGYSDKRQRLINEKKERAAEAKRREKMKEQREKMKAKLIEMNYKGPLPPMTLKPENPEAKPKEGEQPIVNGGNAKPKENDHMMKEMMKDFEIVNPNDEVKKAAEQVAQVIQEKPQDLYLITDAEKIESYMQRIGIDDRKEIDKKLRYFEKANYKYYEVEELQKYRPGEPRKREEEKGNQPLNLKRELTELHDEWKNEKLAVEKSNANRFMDVSGQLSERENAKSRLHLSKSLSREDYENKRRRMDDKFTRRQLDLMFPTAKDRVAKRNSAEDLTSEYSLEMLHRSSPNQLPIAKIYPDRYISADPTDSTYLQEYGFPRQPARALSSFANDKSGIVESTKRRAHELETQQAKRISRLTINLHQNHHYLQKFLERKW